jgi:hypothetical protein
METGKPGSSGLPVSRIYATIARRHTASINPTPSSLYTS